MTEDPRLSEEELLALAQRVSDGEEVDWQEAQREALGSPDSGTIRSLQVISEMGRLYASWEQGVAPRSSAEDEDPVAMGLKEWGDLELVHELGHGASARVFRAFDTRLRRDVALKLLRGGGDRASHREEAALREGRLLARIRHRNVATVYGADRRDGQVGVWMEYIEGRSLQEWVASDGRLSATEATLIGIDLCRALAAVHEAGLLHRDVKAQNVLREKGGRIVLVDLGIGQGMDEETEEPGIISGTPLYLAPEILAGGAASARSDLYSLGVLLFFLVTAVYPVSGGSLEELREAHGGGGRKLLRDLRPDLPLPFVEVVEKALQSNPEARWATAGELEAALKKSLGESLSARMSVARMVRSRRVRRWAAVLTVAAAALAVAGLGLEVQDRAQRKKASEKLAEAGKAEDQSDLHSAIFLAEQAVEADPSFVEGWLYLANTARGTGAYSESLRYSGRAFALKDNQDSDTQDFIEYVYWRDRGDRRTALTALERIALRGNTDFPYYPRALRNLAMAKGEAGQPNAWEFAERALQVNERSVVSRGVLMGAWVDAGRVDQARALAATWEGAPPSARDRLYLQWPLGMARLAQGDLAAARRSFEALAEAGPVLRSNGLLFLAQVALLEGRFGEALGRIEEGYRVENPEGLDRELWMFRYWEAAIHILLGDPVGARRVLEELSGEEAVYHPQTLRFHRQAALLYIELGWIDQAQEVRDRIAQVAVDFPFSANQAFLAQVDSELALAAGRGEEALEGLREVISDLPIVDYTLSQARIHLAAGRCKSAIQSLGTVLGLPRLIYQDHPAFLLTRARLDLARCQIEVGKTGSADDELRQILDAWRENASDHPIYLEAQRLRANLSAPQLLSISGIPSGRPSNSASE